MTNQKHYPDLGSEASSVWNFSTHFEDIISQGKQWWYFEMLIVFSDLKFANLLLILNYHLHCKTGILSTVIQNLLINLPLQV